MQQAIVAQGGFEFPLPGRGLHHGPARAHVGLEHRGDGVVEAKTVFERQQAQQRPIGNDTLEQFGDAAQGVTDLHVISLPRRRCVRLQVLWRAQGMTSATSVVGGDELDPLNAVGTVFSACTGPV